VAVPLTTRQSGVLLHPTSLPSRFGIGDLGPAAYTFLELLARGRQSLWQVLPLGPTGYGNSPYAAPSAFAGNPLLVDPQALLEQGLVTWEEAEPLTHLAADHVEYGQVVPLKRAMLQAAVQRACERDDMQARLNAFCARESEWLDDYVLFAALTEWCARPWPEWDPPLRDRDPRALAHAREQLAEAIRFHAFGQFLFFEQWRSLRARAQALGVRVIGDIPIFVAHDSADVWANRGLFKLDERGLPVAVAGVPPDYFSETGQLWGNPLYDWDAMARDGYRWWIARFRHLLSLVDIVRIDHFRGFESAWEVPTPATTAVDGAWVPGPGAAVFRAVDSALGGVVPVIAEDLGMITDAVRALLAELGYPGMKVLQFAFGGGADNLYLPHNYRDPNCVVYTGTHDNDTTPGWYAQRGDDERHVVLSYLGRDGSDIAYDLIRLALGSVAETAIIPLQDILSLGSQARMNLPGAAEGNWEWRALPEHLEPARVQRLADLTRAYGRAP
jgi:4-alpha-glucanotransferase